MTNITFRTQLLGSVMDFCNESRLPLVTPYFLVELLARLVGYQEESVKLNPQVYLTDDIDLLTGMLPGGDLIDLATTTPDEIGVEKMLKLCAPLAVGDWRVFGQQSDKEMRFGLFRGSSSPISVNVDDIMLTDQKESAVVKAHQVARDCVEIISSQGSRHHVFFDHSKEDTPPPFQHTENLVDAITRRVEQKEKGAVQSFLTRTIMTALRISHGCILAVTNMSRPPKLLSKDAVLLDDPFDFPAMIKALRSEDLPPDFLERKANLLEGMISSDGITLFDEQGRLLGYRCFIRIPAKQEIVGGARRRAFNALCGHLGKGLSAVFMQSQDGWSDFRSIQDE